MEIDWSLVGFEVLNFGILVALFKRFLYRPVQAAIDKRREEIEALRNETEKREAAATTARQSYEAKARDLEVQAQERLDTALARGREEAGQIVAQARSEARQLADAAETEAEVARRRALEQLRPEVFTLAVAAAAKVVHDTASETVALTYARRGAQALKEALSGHDPGETVTVAVGPRSDPTEIAAEVRKVLGPSPSLETEVDPNIVAGVRLSAGGHEIEASASASLRRWYERRVSISAEAAQ